MYIFFVWTKQRKNKLDKTNSQIKKNLKINMKKRKHNEKTTTNFFKFEIFEKYLFLSTIEKVRLANSPPIKKVFSSTSIPSFNSGANVVNVDEDDDEDDEDEDDNGNGDGIVGVVGEVGVIGELGGEHKETGPQTTEEEGGVVAVKEERRRSLQRSQSHWHPSQHAPH